jgi:Arc/MetJ-type ribon-helix-helix transcriptional regulator
MVPRPQLNIRTTDSIIKRIDAKIESGEYSDRSDFVNQAILYQLNRDELRAGLKSDIIRDIENYLERRHSFENRGDLLGEIIHTTVIKILENYEKK